MRGKRALRKLENVSNEIEHAHKCEACSWMVHVAPDRHPSEIQAEFAEHDCKENSFKKKPIGFRY